MKRSFLILAAICLLGSTAFAEKKEIHIVSMNDMHAKIENMPKLAAVVDSLRAIYPSLLVFAAGDNRTGEPRNDLYEIPAYPMVAMMNQIGFDATTLGNHEFDSGQANLAKLINLSNFPYVCCNLIPDPKWGIHVVPTKVFEVDGARIGLVGVVQVSASGHPDTHPDNCTDLTFTPVLETVQKYSSLREECDAVILLSHLGYESDVAISAELPWVDLIIGGHSHTQTEGGEMHNGILITQNVNRLQRITHITLTIEDGRVVDKKAENIEIETFPKENKIVAEMLRFFSNNPAFERVLCQLTKPVSSYEELGCLMTDAWRVETGSDIAITNTGAVRFDSLPAGPFTVSDVLRLDPFGNETVQMRLTGKELKDMLIATYYGDIEYGFPKVSGINCVVIYQKKDPSKIKDVEITMADGSKFDLKKYYLVATSSYTAAIAVSPRADQGHGLNRTTSAIIQDYLEHQGEVDYAGVCRITETVSKR